MKKKRKIVSSDESPLTSNPFAALAGLGNGDAEGPSSEPEPVEPGDEGQSAAPADGALGSLESQGKLVVRREKKGRGGKTVTVIEGLRLSETALNALVRALRRELGCGGSAQGRGSDATIVMGGADHQRVAESLRARGAARVIVGN